MLSDRLDKECKEDRTGPEVLQDHTDAEACKEIIGGVAISLGIERDPSQDPVPENQGGCTFLYNDKGCAGTASLIDVPYNGQSSHLATFHLRDWMES